MTYEELVEKVAHSLWDNRHGTFQEGARAAIAAVAEDLMEPTEEMSDAWERDIADWVDDEIEDQNHPWRVMLSASPLFPKKQHAQ